MDKQNPQDKSKGRVVALLTREEIDFIDRISKDALFSTGHKLSRTDVIRALIDAVKLKEINGEGVHSKAELEKKLSCLMKVSLPWPLYKDKPKRRLK